MANKRTYINADQELIIQGKLTIEGEVEQRQYVNTKVFDQSEFQGDVLVVNSDGFDINGSPTNASIKLRSGNSNAEITYSDSTGSLEFTGVDNFSFENITANTATFTTITDSVLTINSGAISNATTITATSFVGPVTGTVSSLSNHTTTNLAEGSNLYYTQGRFDTAFGAKSTTDLTEGTNLYYTQGRFDTAFGAKSTTNLSEGTNLYYTQARFNSAFSAKSTSDLSEGTNLYYTTTRVNSAFDTRLATKDTGDLAEGSNLYWTTARGNTNFANNLAASDTGDLSEGTNLYYTDARVQAWVNANLPNGGTGNVTSVNGEVGAVVLDTGDISENGNLYFTTARARSAISHIDNGGDGSLTYNSSTGVISYTGPSATEVRAHFSGGDGITITNGSVAVDSTAVRTSGAQSIAGTKTFTGTIDVTGGTINVATQAQTDNSTKAASTAYVRTAVADLIDNAPAALDTLNELAAALNDDATIGSIVSNNTTRIGTLESRNINAGAGLTGGGNLLSDRTFNVGAGTGINVAADSVSVDMSVFDTDDLAEGTNLYYTQARFNSAFGAKSTTDLSEGTNLYWTEARGTANFNANLAASDTGDLTEGTNLYYTQARFNSAFGAKSTTDLSEGTNLYYTTARANTDFDTRLATKDTGDLTEGTNLYYTDTRVDSHLTGGNGITYSSGTIAVDSTVVRTNGDQSIAGNISFTGELIMPQNGILPANDGSIFHDGTDVFAVLNGSSVKLTPQSDVGEIEDVGAGEVDLYAGFRPVALGNANIKYHGIKSVSSDQYITLTEASNVVTIGANTTNLTTLIRGAISHNDAGGDGSFGYNSTTGVFTYTGPSATEVRSHFTAGSGITITNGVIAATGDNYGSWTVQTDSGAGSAEAISSSETMQIVGGTNITVTNVGNIVTIANDNTADITSVSAGDGLTGGGNAGALTLDVGAGTGITVNANDIAVNMGAFSTSDLAEGDNKYFTVARSRIAIDVGGDLSYNSNTGIISFTERTDNEVRALISGGTGISYSNTTGVISLTDTGLITGVTAGGGLTGGGTEGTVTIDLESGVVTAGSHGASSKSLSATVDTYGRVTAISDQDIAISASQVTSGTFSADRIPAITVADMAASAVQTSSETFSDSDTVLMTAAAVADKIESYGFSTTTGDITGVTAGTGLSGGGTSGSVTLNVSGLTTAELADAALQTSAETFSDSDTVLMTAAAIADKIESYGYSTTTGDITGVTAGTGLDGGGTSGSVTLNVSGLTLTEFADAAIQTSAEAFGNNDTSLMTSAAIEDKILSYGYSTVDTLKAVKQLGLITLQLDDASGLVDEVLMDPTNHITIDSGGAGVITFGTDGTSANTGGTLVARDGSGNFSAGVITATATAAYYADLAEKYATDVEYEPGTVVVFGGVAEVTECTETNSYKVAGIISTDPAYMMNESAQGQYVALRGRVPCKVVGKVRKGDVLITSDVPGHAIASDQPHFVGAACIVGKAISSKDTDGVGIVEVLV